MRALSFLGAGGSELFAKPFAYLVANDLPLSVPVSTGGTSPLRGLLDVAHDAENAGGGDQSQLGGRQNYTITEFIVSATIRGSAQYGREDMGEHIQTESLALAIQPSVNPGDVRRCRRVLARSRWRRVPPSTRA
jgi:hypothetical protein